MIAMVAGLTPAVSAQPAPSGGSVPTVGVAPEIFQPDRINRTPTGSDDPSNAKGGSSGLAGLDEPGEVVERRTEDSRTFATEDGRFETVFYGGAVNYQDARGDWQPIDNRLVPGTSPGAALRNAAAAVELSLPPVLGAGPVRVAGDDISVGFTLQGAKATPSPGLSKGLPGPASDTAAQASATYANALPGVDVTYTATANGVKEDVVLTGPEAATTFDFTVDANAGLTAQETPGGGIDFVDGEGNARATFAPPFAYDASFKATGAESAFTEEAVSLSIVEASPQLVVRLEADQAWLGAPERAWPVVIDPVLVIDPPAYADTYLRKAAPDSAYGSSTRLLLGSGTEARRPVLARNVVAAFDEPVTVVSAEVQLYATTDTTAQVVAPVGAYEVTNGWDPNQATWNSRLTGTRWNTAGGDFDPQPLFVNNNVTGAPGWRTWTITSSVQAWLDGQRSNPGVLLKYADESSGALVSFASSNEADPALLPRIAIHWEPLAGDRGPFGFESFDLGPGGSAAVNVASGNLTIAERDLGVPGTAWTPPWTASIRPAWPRWAAWGLAGGCSPSPRSACTSPLTSARTWTWASAVGPRNCSSSPTTLTAPTPRPTATAPPW
jgi:hypothetical protein